MGGLFWQNVEGDLLQALRKDNQKKLKEIIVNNSLNPDALYTKRKRTLVQLSCYFLSPKCLKTLIELNYDYNKKEIINNYSPLYIACKFNSLPIVKILLSKDDCKILQKTTDNNNEFEIAFLKGNYDICYYLLYEYLKAEEIKNEENDENNINNEKEKEEEDINTQSINLKDNKKKKKKLKPEIVDENKNLEQPYQKFFLSEDFDLDNCISLQEQNKCPLFNMPLFYQSLLDRVPPSKCPSFAAERKRTTAMLTKIPDPNETWGHFFKRLVNFELYNPPLVDKRNVSQMNSMYMNAQMKLMESEYGIKMSYYEGDNKEKENLDNSNQDENEEEPIIKVTKKNKKKKKEEIGEESEEKNIIKINVKSSIKKSINKKNKEEEVNTSVRDKDDFYSVDVNNTSGRKVNEKVEDNENEENEDNNN